MIWQTLLIDLAVILTAMFVLWIVGTALRDVSIVDPFWGAGFVVVAWLGLLVNAAAGYPRTNLLVGLTTVWGLRLSLFLLWRNWGKGEDRRYTAMREQHGARFWWVSLLTVFLLQGLILWFVALPIQIATARALPHPLGWLDGLGVALWGLGFLFESVGDWQLARFKADPRNAGRVMDRGLWRFTRHPNYFGDFCVWWGIYLIAVAGGAWWTIASPLLMSILLMRVSGVSLLESTIVDRRPEYAAYKARTNAFFPGPPRRK
jgi:steroid 5-alpha reductase family enzyme